MGADQGDDDDDVDRFYRCLSMSRHVDRRRGWMAQSFREAHIEKLDLWKLYFRAGSSKIELLKKSMF